MFILMLEDTKNGTSSSAICVDIQSGWGMYEFIVFEESSPCGFDVAMFRFSEAENSRGVCVFMSMYWRSRSVLCIALVLSSTAVI